MKKSTGLYLLGTLLAALGAKLAMLPAWADATTPAFMGDLAVTFGATTVAWCLRSPINRAPRHVNRTPHL